MKIAISGTSGLVGSALKNHFKKLNFEVTEITRHRTIFNKNKIVYLNTEDNYIDEKALEGHDVIIHLAGANISAKKWTLQYKQEILASRINSTKLIVSAIKSMSARPKIFFCASAVGYYGNHDPQQTVDEKALSGHGFLAQVCREWENASAELILKGVRLVHMRFGVVLNKKGGALAKMLPVFYFGLGGVLGSGRQPMSWIALDEIPAIVDFIIENDKVNGPVNFVAPGVVSNREFTKTLGKVIFRPTIFPVPGFLIKAMFGQMGQELLLEGARVVPQALIDAKYPFMYPNLEQALRKIL